MVKSFLNSSRLITRTGRANKKTVLNFLGNCVTPLTRLYVFIAQSRSSLFIYYTFSPNPLWQENTAWPFAPPSCKKIPSASTGGLRPNQARRRCGDDIRCVRSVHRPAPTRFSLHAAQNRGGKNRNNHPLLLDNVSSQPFDTMTTIRACLEWKPLSLGMRYLNK